MIVCDECRDVDARAFDCHILLTKQDDPKGARGTTSRRVPPPRQIVDIPVTLCDRCLTAVCKRLGTLKQRGELLGSRIKDAPYRPCEKCGSQMLPEEGSDGVCDVCRREKEVRDAGAM